jgi:hypothetical protein
MAERARNTRMTRNALIMVQMGLVCFKKGIALLLSAKLQK